MATYSPKNDSSIVNKNNSLNEVISFPLKYIPRIFMIEKYNGTASKSLKKLLKNTIPNDLKKI